MRSTAREAVFKYLYAKAFNKDLPADFFKGLLKDGVTDDDRLFAEKLLETVENNAGEIENIIASRAKDYSIDRIFPADKCALAIGVAEIRYCPEIPAAVAIDQAVSLAAKYSAEKSMSFVNGILAAVNETKKEQDV